MAEKSTIARPYAQAAFDIAKEAGDLKGWSDMLQLLAVVASDALMQNTNRLQSETLNQNLSRIR